VRFLEDFSLGFVIERDLTAANGKTKSRRRRRKKIAKRRYEKEQDIKRKTRKR
jgi:hypothetical protein